MTSPFAKDERRDRKTVRSVHDLIGPTARQHSSPRGLDERLSTEGDSVRYNDGRIALSYNQRCHVPITFADGGIRFLYPENWQLEREDNESGWTVSIHSPGTAFLIVVFRADVPPPTELADTALEALREEYPELEAEDEVGAVAGQPAVGHEIRFFTLDLTNTCWTRSFHSPQGTILIMCQTADLEPEKNEQVLRAICASVKVEAD
jgi:hypothetical protein